MLAYGEGVRMSEQKRAERRLHRPSWRDPKLGVGVVLVAAAVALGSWSVSAASQSVEVYVADRGLAPGEALSAENVGIGQVRPGTIEQHYVLADEELPPDTVLLRAVGAGELIPRAALGRAEELDVRPVLVPLPAVHPSALEPGRLVDLWVTDPPRQSAVGDADRDEPRVLAEALVVSEVVAGDSVLSGAGSSSIEVLVPREDLARVLDAVSGPGEIVVVPVLGSAG